jgi:hypothetical protein
MLTGGTDGLYRAALAGPHRIVSYLQVWREGMRVDTYGDDGLPFFSGTISATLQSQVTRQLTFGCHESLWPVNNSDLLAPYGNEIRAWYGVSAGAAPDYVWQVFRGRIDTVTLEENGVVSVQCVDRAAAVKESGFVRPQNSHIGSLVTSEYRLLVTDGVPDATFGTFDAIGTITPQLTWEQDRGDACDDLAKAAGAFWYALANGDYVLRFVPWAVTQTSVLTLSDGEGGVLVSAVPVKSRSEVFNQITVTGERADGTTPVFALAQDTDPDSPTNMNGAFGVRSKTVSLQATTTQGQANSLARTLLRLSKALTQSWTLSMPNDASLELGDAITINARGLPQELQVVQGFNLSLLGDAPMTIQTQAQQLGSTTASEG